IQVSKLTKNVTDSHLQEIFGSYGRIRTIEMANMLELYISLLGQMNKGTAFIDYDTRAEAEKAISYMDGGQLDGAVLSC
ncbi:hypothetical protein C2G38_1904644, partial [Gigaspora rosea]